MPWPSFSECWALSQIFQENTNQNCNEMIPHACWNGWYQKGKKITCVDRNVKKREPSDTWTSLWLNSKEFMGNAGDTCYILGLGRSPGGGYGNPLKQFCREKSHKQRSLEGYSPWVCKESEATEHILCYWWKCKAMEPLQKIDGDSSD